MAFETLFCLLLFLFVIATVMKELDFSDGRGEASSYTKLLEDAETALRAVREESAAWEGRQSLMRRGIKNAADSAVEALRINSKPVNGTKDIARVGTVSSGDPFIGNLIAEAMDKVSQNGVITIEESKTAETYSDIVEGMVPAVASSYKISDTGDTFTFTLRDNVHFHNGNVVTAKDVCYSILRAAGLNDGKPLIDGFGAVASVTGTDNTIVIKLKEPNIEFLSLLTAAIIPYGSDPAKELIGTGPFKFVSRTPQESILLEKFDGYWGTPAHEPYFD